MTNPLSSLASTNTVRWESILSPHNRSLRASAVRAVASLLEPPYRLVVSLRNVSFDRGWRQPRKLPRPVISIGNLTAGGTGKTPMVIDLARKLQAVGYRPAVLLRGYKGHRTGSDEAAVLRSELGSQVPIGVNADRAKSAHAILETCPAVTLFLLDDGFQHRQIHRDVNIVLISATCPFGYNHVLPRGLLREDPEGLRRADAVIVTHADEISSQDRQDLDDRLKKLAGQGVLAHVAHRWVGLRDRHDASHPLEELRDCSAMGVCGIGDPASFLGALRRHAARLTAQHVFPDHHRYSAAEVTALLACARDAGAAVVLTEKDWVKWRALLPQAVAEGPLPPIYRPRLEIAWLDGAEATVKLLCQCLPQNP